METIAGLPGTYDRYASCVLVEFERRVATGPGTYTSTFFRYCNTTQDVVYSGAAGADRPAVGAGFTHRSFRTSKIVQDAGLGIVSTISFDDHDGLMKDIALLYNMLDWVVRVWQVGLDSAFNVTWIKLKQKGLTGDIDWDVDEGNTFAVDVGPYRNLEEIKSPREGYTASCRYKTHFKTDPRCAAVTVATTCDGQPATCRSYGNYARFGGFPDAPAAGTKLGTWGGGTIELNNRTWPPV